MKRKHDQAVHDRARRLAAVHPLGTVAQILCVTPSEITRMKKRGWQARATDPRQRQRPADFQMRQAALSFAELVRHYRCGPRAVVRWMAELRAEGKARASWRGDALRAEPRRTASPASSRERTRALLAVAGVRSAG